MPRSMRTTTGLRRLLIEEPFMPLFIATPTRLRLVRLLRLRAAAAKTAAWRRNRRGRRVGTGTAPPEAPGSSLRSRGDGAEEGPAACGQGAGAEHKDCVLYYYAHYKHRFKAVPVPEGRHAHGRHRSTTTSATTTARRAADTEDDDDDDDDDEEEEEEEEEDGPHSEKLRS